MRRDAVWLVVTLALSLLVWTGPARAGTGSGPPFEFPTGIAVEASGALVVVEYHAVVRVDPVSGDRTLVSTSMARRRYFAEIAVEASGAFAVVNHCLGDLCGLPVPLYEAVLRVDPTSGQRTLVSGGRLGTQRGNGPRFNYSTGIAVDANGALLVVDNALTQASSALSAVVRVDPVSGDRTLVSDAATGSGPPFESPQGIAVEASGMLVVVDLDLQAVIRVDPVSGDRTVLSQ